MVIISEVDSFRVHLESKFQNVKIAYFSSLYFLFTTYFLNSSINFPRHRLVLKESDMNE